jgi:hypothetical protein
MNQVCKDLQILRTEIQALITKFSQKHDLIPVFEFTYKYTFGSSRPSDVIVTINDIKVKRT